MALSHGTMRARVAASPSARVLQSGGGNVRHGDGGFRAVAADMDDGSTMRPPGRLAGPAGPTARADRWRRGVLHDPDLPGVWLLRRLSILSSLPWRRFSWRRFFGRRVWRRNRWGRRTARARRRRRIICIATDRRPRQCACDARLRTWISRIAACRCRVGDRPFQNQVEAVASAARDLAVSTDRRIVIAWRVPHQATQA